MIDSNSGVNTKDVSENDSTIDVSLDVNSGNADNLNVCKFL